MNVASLVMLQTALMSGAHYTAQRMRNTYRPSGAPMQWMELSEGGLARQKKADEESFARWKRNTESMVALIVEKP